MSLTSSDRSDEMARSPRTGLVLAGGAARGAYEVGVVQYVVEEVARDLGRDVALDILSGTSVGAINVSALAAYADEPRLRGRRLAAHWRRLRIGELLHADARGITDWLRSLLGGEPRRDRGDARRGGILDPAGIERVIAEAIPFGRIGEHIARGHLQALTVSTTHVGSGRTAVFMQTSPSTPRWTSEDPHAFDVLTKLGPHHIAASAAIPSLLPAVRIDGDFYCDGGLRQNVPLSPAVRLGADRLLVVSPREQSAAAPALQRDRERAYPGAFLSWPLRSCARARFRAVRAASGGGCCAASPTATWRPISCPTCCSTATSPRS